MQRLNRFSRIVQNLQKERKKYRLSSFKLHSSYVVSAETENQNVKLIPKARPEKANSPESRKEDIVSERYESEIASTSKMKEYSLVADKYKKLMLIESKELQRQYSEEVRQVRMVEETTERIANMLSEFVSILHNQTEMVDDIHQSSEEAIESVRRSNRELQSTIDRSRSHQWNMVILSTVLALLILLLDAFTP
jgi:Fe2+ transport system protein B